MKLSLTELRKVQKAFSSTSYSYVMKAMKLQSLSSLQYNVVVVAIIEVLLKAGIEEPMGIQLLLSGRLEGTELEPFWGWLKLVSISGIIRAIPTHGRDLDASIARYEECMQTITNSRAALGRPVTSLPDFWGVERSMTGTDRLVPK